jgi:hypothetical protein
VYSLAFPIRSLDDALVVPDRGMHRRLQARGDALSGEARIGDRVATLPPSSDAGDRDNSVSQTRG